MGARRKRGKSPKGQGATLDAAVVLRIFRESGKPLSDKEVARGLKGIVFKFHDLRHLLEELREAGKLIRRFSMTLYIDRCTHCSQCEESCPVDAFKMDSSYCHSGTDMSQ